MKLNSIGVQLALENGEWHAAIEQVLRYYGSTADPSKLLIDFRDWSGYSYFVRIEMADGIVYIFCDGKLYKTTSYRNIDQTRVGLLGVVTIACPT